MAAVTLTISGQGKTWQAQPDAEGTIIGRSELCDVVLESPDISREHARIFRDPFGRWIIEDLGSSNGIFINGKRVQICAVLPGEPLIIGPFSLSIHHAFAGRIESTEPLQTAANIIVDDFETEIFSDKSTGAKTLSEFSAGWLDQIADDLSELTTPTALYPELCRHLARQPRTVATVLRLPPGSKTLPKSPDILACHFGDISDDTIAQETAGRNPSHLAFRVSKHVLESVRSTGEALMAKSIYSSDTEITASVLDEHSPRTVICAALGETAGPADLLYLDIPIDKTTPDMLEFIRALCPKIVSARKSLIETEAKARRSVLDYQLSLAEQISSRFAPPQPRHLPDARLTLYHKPVIWVGGDYCDAWPLQDGRLAFAIGHILDKGLPAAMAIAEIHTFLGSALSFCTELSEVMTSLNEHLLRTWSEGTSASLLLGLFDPQTSELVCAGAGTLQAFIVGPQSTGCPLDLPPGPPFATADAVFKTSTETLEQGAWLLAFTDGLTKTTSTDGTEFGVDRVVNILKTAADRSPGHIIDSLTHAANDFRHRRPQQADITILGII
jgi:sigma-B regulation protein RsbU (phosphoserine phosphatase)